MTIQPVKNSLSTSEIKKPPKPAPTPDCKGPIAGPVAGKGFIEAFVSTEENRKIYAFISWSQLLNLRVSQWVNFLTKNVDSSLWTNLAPTDFELHAQFFLRLIQFKKDKDPKPLFEIMAQSYEMVKALPQDFLSHHEPVLRGTFNTLIFLRKHSTSFDFSLLDETALSVCPEFVLAPSDHYTAAANSYLFLYNAFCDFAAATAAPPAYAILDNMLAETVEVYNPKFITFLLKSDTTFSRNHKSSILLFARTALMKFEQKIESNKNTLLQYGSFLKNHYSQIIDFTKPAEEVLKAPKNRNTWKELVPLLIEAREFIDDYVREFVEISDLLKYFTLYLEFGELDRLKTEFESNPFSDPTHFISEHFKNFVSHCETNKAQQLKVLMFLKNPANKSMLNLYKSAGAHKKSLLDMQAIMHTLLDPAITTAEKWSDYLFAEETQDVKIRTQTHGTLEPIDDIEEEKGRTPVAEAVRIKLPNESLPLEKRLQGLKCKMSESVQFLSAKCKQFGVAEALVNSEIHWESLLSTVKRLLETKENLSDAELFSIVLDVVREGSLAVEQSLSALDRRSNNVTDVATLKAHLTHNLSHILWSCQFKDGMLPIQYRTWIREMNLGEILSRDLRNCKIDGTYVEKLLTKARLLAGGNKTFSRKEVIADTLEFFKRTGLICIELQKQMLNIAKKVAPLQKDFVEFCREIEKAMSTDSTPISKPSKYDLHSVTDPILTFTTQCEIREVKTGLENILNNLCLQLQTEMELHPMVEPIDAYRHLSKIILLNQMIAEKYLLNLHDALVIPYTLSEVDHDLATLIQSLGMGQKDFTSKEWAFLTQGKALRLLVRYPESYAAVYAKGSAKLRLEKAVRDAITFSKNQEFQKGNLAEGGFAISSPKLDVIKAVVEEDLQTLAFVLNKVAMRKHPDLGFEDSESKR